MMMPSVFEENLFHDFLDVFSKPLMQFESYIDQAHVMKTDVKEFADRYEFEVELPGVDKDDVKAEFANGYLTISATCEYKDTKEEQGTKECEKTDSYKYLCRERSVSTASRRFYIDKDIKKDEIKAIFENGILTLRIPKVPQEELAKSNTITIQTI